MDMVNRMTTTRSRREEYSSSNVVRVLHPSRPLSPHYNKSINQSNNSNIDYLIDDLQQSVSRPGSSLGFEDLDNISQRQMSTKTMREVQYLTPSNSTTIVRERSSSPNSKHERVIKTANYEYSAGSNGSGIGNYADDVNKNISQLDNLLMDLKHERDTSLERERKINIDSGIDSGLFEPGSSVTKTTRTYNTNRSNSGNRLPTNRELIFDSPDGYGTTVTTTTTTQSRGRPKSPSIEKHIKTRIERDVEYDIIPTRDRFPEKDKYLTASSTKSYSSNNYSTLSSNTGKPVVPYTETVRHVDSTDLPQELKDIPLSNDILPGPGTKVTTTIKTYTYEIPAEPHQTNKTVMYKNETYNTTSRNGTDTLPRPISPSPHSTYRSEYSEYNKNNTSTTNYVPPTTGPSKTIYYKETNETTDNKIYPGGPNGPSGPVDRYPTPTHVHPPNQTIIYKEDVRNTTNTHYPPQGRPYTPTAPNDYPTGPKKTYYYKNEKTTTKNTLYGPPGSRQPTDDYPNNALPAPNDYSPNDYPNGPNTSYYKYTTKTTTKNSYGQPNEPQPMPFPTDVEYVHEPHPPKRLDDLLATFDDTDKKNGPVIEEYTPRKEVNTAVASDKPVTIPSKNIAGPAVFYPPGKEIVKSEEEGAAWLAQGGYAKARGNYMYEADAKSKSKSKKGGAIVPVCLPLCCAMPCSIM